MNNEKKNMIDEIRIILEEGLILSILAGIKYNFIIVMRTMVNNDFFLFY